jgi:hypothetical protein
MAAVARNEPCPCGSGKKYKHCCLQKEVHRAGFDKNVGILMAAAALVVSIAVVFIRDSTQDGVLAGLSAGLIVGLYFTVFKPPPGRGGKGDAAGISFGRKR